MLAPNSISSPDRIRALKASGLLDLQPEAEFDQLTKLVTLVLQVPVALLTMVTETQQFFKSQCGLPEPIAFSRDAPQQYSLCQHVVWSGLPLVLEDTRIDPVLAGNSAITQLGVIAYAGVPVRDPDGAVLGSLCALDMRPRHWTQNDLDVLTGFSAQVTTELIMRRRCASLTKEVDENRCAMDDRRQQVRMDVHDLRSPLAAMCVSVSLLERLGPLTDRQRECLALCDRSADVLSGLLSDILDIGAIELGGASAIRVHGVQPEALIAGAMDQVGPLAQERSIRITAHCAEDAPPILADSGKLQRVLVNLLANAIKYTPTGGGHITMDVSLVPKQAEPQVLFRVRDSGIGIASSDRERIFNEGERVNADATTHMSAGLGLTFCKRVVEAHGGRIWVDANPSPDAGSTFSFIIPAAVLPRV